MKITFEKRGTKFEVEVIKEDAYITAKGIQAIAHPYKHRQHGWGYEVRYNRAFLKALGAGPEIETVFITHESAEQVKNAIDAYREEENARKQKEKEERKQRIIAGAEKIRVSYHDGEYLSGHEVLDEVAAELLEELGLARYVEGWGYHIDEELVRTYGTEFTYQQAKEFVQPRKEAEARKQKEREEIRAKFEEAKATGKPVELYRFIVDCNDPRLECSTDIIIVYAMPDGSKDERRIHTY
jgi:hypothetical protein